MHHIEVVVDDSYSRFGNLYYRVSAFCELVGEKSLGSFSSLPDAVLFAKAKANELGVSFVVPVAAKNGGNTDE